MANNYPLKMNINNVDNLTAGSLAVSDFRHDFWKVKGFWSAKDQPVTEEWAATEKAVVVTLPKCEAIAGDPKNECTGAGSGNYRRVEDKKGMEEYLHASLTYIKAAIAAQDAPGKELELPGSIFAKLKYKVRVLSKSKEDRNKGGFRNILAGHKLGFVVDTYTSTFKYLIHDSLEAKRTYPLIWINNNATAFDPATKSYPGSGKASDKSSIGRTMISVEKEEEEVAAVWRGGKLPYRDMYETILYSPWLEGKGEGKGAAIPLNDALIEKNLFFSKGEIKQYRASSAPRMPLIDLIINDVKWTIPTSSVGWISAQIQNLWLRPSSKLEQIWHAEKSSRRTSRAAAEQLAQMQRALPVIKKKEDGGGDDEGEGDGGTGAHAGAASPEQFRILSDTFSEIQEAPIPGFLALSKRLGDQGQALSCRREELYTGIQPVFVTIDQLAFVAAVMYNIPAAIFCGKGDPGPTFMIYKESLDDPVLRLGNIITNLKSISENTPPPLRDISASATRTLEKQMGIMGNEWLEISRGKLEDETQYKDFLKKIISLDARSKIIKDLRSIVERVALLDKEVRARGGGALTRTIVDALQTHDTLEDGIIALLGKAGGISLPRNVFAAAKETLKAPGNEPSERLYKIAFAAASQWPDDSVDGDGNPAAPAPREATILLQRVPDTAGMNFQESDPGDVVELTQNILGKGTGGKERLSIRRARQQPVYKWLADQADEYLGFMKTLISLNDLLDAAAKSAEEQEKAGKRKSKRVSISEAAIKNIQLTPEGAKSTDDFKSQFEKLTPMRVTYSGAEQLKIANDILIIINKQAEFSQIVTGFWDRAIEAAEKKDTGLSEPWFFGYSYVPPRKSGSRNVIEKIPPNVWLSQLYEFIKVHMDWTEDDDGGGGGGEGGGGGGGGDGGDAYGGGGGGGDGNEPYTTEEEMVAQWPDIFKEGQTHEESAAAAAATKGGGKKGGNKFPFKDDEIIRTYVGIVLVTMDLVAESDAVDRTHLDNEMRKGLSTFLGGDIAVDNAIAAVNYAFTQDPASAAPAAAAINEPQASGNIQIVEGGIISPTFYNQLKRLNLEVGNGVDLLQFLRYQILGISNGPRLIDARDTTYIQGMVQNLQGQVGESLKAYGFTAAAAPAAAAADGDGDATIRTETPAPAAAEAPAEAPAAEAPAEAPAAEAPAEAPAAAAAAAAPTTPRRARRVRPPPGDAGAAAFFLKRARRDDEERQGNNSKRERLNPGTQTAVDDYMSDGGESDGVQDMLVRRQVAFPRARRPSAARGGKRKKKRTRRRKPKKRRKRSKKKRKPKKKQTRRRKSKKKRTRRRKSKKKRTRRRRR